MLCIILFIALFNLVLGYCLGETLLRPLSARRLLLAADVPLTTADAQLAQQDQTAATPLLTADTDDVATTPLTKNSAVLAAKCWTTACVEIRQDLTSFRDRIRYALTANDKKINQSLATELRGRTTTWQKLLQEKLTEFSAELERDPAANVDCVAPEMCLSQIETLQTNLNLLDWSEESDSILKKVEREVEAVKNLLPRGM